MPASSDSTASPPTTDAELCPCLPGAPAHDHNAGGYATTDPIEDATCPECDGAGEVYLNPRRDENGIWIADELPCGPCEGSGVIPGWLALAYHSTD